MELEHQAVLGWQELDGRLPERSLEPQEPGAAATAAALAAMEDQVEQEASVHQTVAFRFSKVMKLMNEAQLTEL